MLDHKWTVGLGAALFLLPFEARAGGEEKPGCCSVLCNQEVAGGGTPEEKRRSCEPVEHAVDCKMDSQAVFAACARLGANWTPEEGVEFDAESRCDTDAEPPACAGACTEDPPLPTESWTVEHSISDSVAFLEWTLNDRVAHSEGPCLDAEECPCCTEGLTESRMSLSFDFEPPIGSGATFSIGGTTEADTQWCAAAKCEDDPVWSCEDDDSCTRDAETRTFESSQRVELKLIDWTLLKLFGSVTLAGRTSSTHATFEGTNTCGGCCSNGLNPEIDKEASNLSLSGSGKAVIGWGWFKYTISVELARGCVEVETGTAGSCAGGQFPIDNRSMYLGIACGVEGSSEITDVASLCAEGAFYDACFKTKPADGGCFFGLGDPSSC